jgi:iron complex transport system substrate-binding protein
MTQCARYIYAWISGYPYRKKWILPALGMAILLPLLTNSCQPKKVSAPTPAKIITDMLSRKVEIPQEVKHIVGVGPGALRFLVYMQLTDHISGVEDIELRPGRAYAYAQPSLKKKPIIGPMRGGDAELLTANQPDVIFMTGGTAGDADDLQNQTGIPVVALQTGNFNRQRETFNRALQMIGAITQSEERAAALIQFINREIAALKKCVPDPHSHLRVYVGGISYSGARGLTSTLPFYDAFEFVNALNVAAGLAGTANAGGTRATTIDMEQLIVWNPDYLFIDAAGLTLSQPQLSPESPFHNTLSAFRKKTLYTLMPYNWYSTNYETILVNAWYIASVIYPQRVSDVHFLARRKAIYEFMIGKDVSDDLLKLYEGWKPLNNILPQ